MAEVEAKGVVWCKSLKTRYVMALLMCYGLTIIYVIRANISITMVRMLNHTYIEEHAPPKTLKQISEECPGHSINETKSEDGPFTWSESIQGTILSSYFWGYLFFQIPGGRAAEVYSAKWILFACILINILASGLCPISAVINYGVLIFMRVVEGIASAVIFPAHHAVLSRWCPSHERSFMTSIVCSGMSLGMVTGIPTAGVIAKTVGWEAVFYIMEIFFIPWCFLWVFLMQDTPNQQKYISVIEREYINTNLQQNEAIKPRHVPWKSVLTSSPFWAILVAHSCHNWGWYLFLTQLPFYFRKVLKCPLATTTTALFVAYLANAFMGIEAGRQMYRVIYNNKFTITEVRKFCTGMASALPAICLLIICNIGCKYIIAIVLMTLAIIFKAWSISGFFCNHLDIAPNFAGTLMGLTNTVATIPGILSPILVGYLTKDDNHTMAAWGVIFYITIGIYLFEFIFYTIFASGELQTWNDSELNEVTSN